jgi:hypothetical protein
MIQYTNILRHDNVPFEEYLRLPGYSHSYLKRERFGMVEELTMTDNIMIGKLVDGILTDQEGVDMKSPLYSQAKLIAYDIMKTWGAQIKLFRKQVSYTADVNHNGFIMPTTGRLDFELPKHAVVDLKVTKSKDVDGLINYMGYKNQVWHYAKMAQVNDAYIMIHSIPLRRNFIRAIDCSSNMNEFWADKCINFGKVSVC